MPTLLTHPAVPLVLGLGLGTTVISRRLLAVGVIAAVLPDLDVAAFRAGIAYTDILGHRGVSHSIAFALLAGLFAQLFAERLRSGRVVAFVFAAFCMASHGLLDMFTDAGEGIAFLWPWSDERLFAPWRMIEASPLSLHRFLGERGREVLWSEAVHVWLPGGVVLVLLTVVRLGWRGRAGTETRERSKCARS